MLPFERPVSGKFGAPMGRRSDPIESFSGMIHLRVVPYYDGDYDKGGAYWGSGSSTSGRVWCAWDNSGHECYLRARSRDDAIAQLPATWRFYRGKKK